MSDIFWLPDQLIGKVGERGGVALALRGSGDELLFAAGDDTPMAWVKTTEFCVDPKTVLTADDVVEEPPEELPGAGGELVTRPTGPPTVRRRP